MTIDVPLKTAILGGTVDLKMLDGKTEPIEISRMEKVSFLFKIPSLQSYSI